jgi:hypothetical protein
MNLIIFKEVRKGLFILFFLLPHIGKAQDSILKVKVDTFFELPITQFEGEKEYYIKINVENISKHEIFLLRKESQTLICDSFSQLFIPGITQLLPFVILDRKIGDSRDIRNPNTSWKSIGENELIPDKEYTQYIKRFWKENNKVLQVTQRSSAKYFVNGIAIKQPKEYYYKMGSSKTITIYQRFYFPEAIRIHNYLSNGNELRILGLNVPFSYKTDLSGSEYNTKQVLKSDLFNIILQ